MTEVEHLDVHHDGYPTHRRKARFDWSNLPLHWVPDDPFATHFWNALHLILPEGSGGSSRPSMRRRHWSTIRNWRRRSKRSCSRNPGTPGRTNLFSIV